MHLGMVECHIPFSGHYDLASDLVFRKIMSGAYLLYFWNGNLKSWCDNAFWDDEVLQTIIGSL